jgi:hypothetical protein
VRGEVVPAEAPEVEGARAVEELAVAGEAAAAAMEVAAARVERVAARVKGEQGRAEVAPAERREKVDAEEAGAPLVTAMAAVGMAAPETAAAGQVAAAPPVLVAGAI